MGDSLGAEIEFLSLAEIRARFPEGLIDLPPHDDIRGAITDDTQMTLFTAEGILGARASDAWADLPRRSVGRLEFWQVGDVMSRV